MPLKRKRTSSKGKLPSSVPKIKKLETETETEIEESCDIETPVCEDEEASEEIINSKPAELDQDITEDSNIIVETEDVTPSTSQKKKKMPGVIYLSSIPEGMQYNDIYRVFCELGEVGRMSLMIGGPQPRHAKNKRYAEGWVEFLDKKKAKRCVLLLNNQTVGGKKRSKWFDCIWHMRYLPKFQWSHLTERLVYEQASTQQRMRTEINQARQEAQHFAEQIDFKQKDLRMANKHADWKQNSKRTYEYTQKITDDEIRKRKVGSERVKKLEKSRSNVLGSLFGKAKDS